MFVRLNQNGENIMQMPHSQFPSALPICEYGAHLRSTLPLEGYTKACHTNLSLPVKSCSVVL